MAQGLESTKVLLNGIMKTMEFTSTSILKTRSFKYHADMGLVYQAWSIVS